MNNLYYIALNTFRESIRSKILYSVLFFAFILVGVSALLGSVTIGDQVKVIKDFGLFSISLFSVLYAAISGGTLLHKELSRRTVYNILAKAVERWQFVMGKYIGMLFTVSAITALMACGLTFFVYFFEHKFDVLIIVASLHVIFELVIICACAMFFSAIVVTPLFVGVFTFGVFLAGRSSEYLLYFINDENKGSLLASIFTGMYHLIPHLDKINISNNVVYGIDSSFAVTLASAGYAFSYAAVLLILACLIFSRREFN